MIASAPVRNDTTLETMTARHAGETVAFGMLRLSGQSRFDERKRDNRQKRHE